ncbi:1-phosphatidylinositol-3-phosphate 5-kinase FAB1B-like, partial [Trifolium medium]|nr:1-phosphatidylinositol-3-phosphate 5-kinase FAB1B-like [Trifolium medium]
ILLRGADMDELKKVKHVVQYAVFAAYHLAMETSFLADEGVSLPELPLNSLALPNKSSSIQRSISTVPGFTVPGNEKPQVLEPDTGPRRTKSVTVAELASSICNTGSLSNGSSRSLPPGTILDDSSILYSSIVGSGDDIPELYHNNLLSKQPLVKETSVVDNTPVVMDDPFVNDSDTAEKIYQGILAGKSQNENDHSQIYANQLSGSESLSPSHAQNHTEKIVITNEEVPQKEEFPPSPSDHQSILVSLSSR